ncbi:MAG TPA: Rieske 2Fe-2S domain-containing protein [Dehalococcoidia bacterium]|nr:Rieske 2Fe-2S domain-containing protein [Dehalococcoidia bacterium]
MLNAQDNEYLCRIGPGTPMGNFMRQYWMPAIRSDELPAPDCPPVRIRLLGESLIGYRTTSGAVGLMQNSCPHRGASMFFGRNEEEGLRCVYHGWKFDVQGNCVDMPSEPAESNFRNKVHATAYPTNERNGIIWAYMGPREVPPSLPDIEANLLCEGPRQISVLYRPCNWMQGLEGEMDTVHAAFLHSGASFSEDYEPGTFGYYQYRQRDAKFDTQETDYGLCNGAYRPAEADSYYYRITQILWPFFHMIPGGALGEGIKIGAYVPMDDDHHLQWEIGTLPAPGSTSGGSNNFLMRGQPVTGNLEAPLGLRRLPNTSDWYGRFRSDQTLENDYLIDREEQRTWKSYTGIAGGRIQDCAMTETMGTIYDRSHEHLGTTDTMIIRARRKLINMARALEEHGTVPPGVDSPEVYRQRSGEIILPRSSDWWESYQALRERFNAGVQTTQAPISTT